MSERDPWIRAEDELPQKDQRVEWISPSGLHLIGKFLGGDVWLPESSAMYVYYTPLFWRAVK